jgi:hypothetical protein
MKTTVTVRKIPLESVLSILLEMRDLGIEHVNFECEMTPERDNIHVIQYKGVNNPSQQSIDIDTDTVEEDRLNYIKKIIKDHGSN